MMDIGHKLSQNMFTKQLMMFSWNAHIIIPLSAFFRAVGTSM